MDETGLEGSSVKPLAVLFLVVMGILTLRLPRRYASMPLLITTCYMPLGQAFIVAGLHFQFFRVLLLLGVCRVMMRRESADLVLSPLDRVFIWWGIAGVVLGTLADFGWERFVNRAGEGFNAFTAYFLFRCWIQNLEDVIQTVRLLALSIVPVAVSMLVEKFTMRNIFFVFGGVPEITLMREGKLRCQGAFRHPITAGTYAATLFPLFVGLWFQPRVKRWISVVGICGALIMTVAASTSGALLASVTAVIGFALWGYERQDANRPVGDCADIRRSGPGNESSDMVPAGKNKRHRWWHRMASLLYLIDQAIGHFNEWWLFGSAVTAHWAPGGTQVLAVDPRNMDITNNYIAEALGGGLVKLGLFIAMIVWSYKFVGRWTKESTASPYSRCMFVWSLGVCLTGHCVSFLSIAYFDQIVVMWYWLLAGMSMLCLLRERSWNIMLPESISDAGLGEPVGAGQN